MRMEGKDEFLDLDEFEEEDSLDEDDNTENEDVDLEKDTQFLSLFNNALETEKNAVASDPQSQPESAVAQASEFALNETIAIARAKKEAREKRRREKQERRLALRAKLNNLKASLLARLAVCINVNDIATRLGQTLLEFIPSDISKSLSEGTVESAQALLSWIRRTFRRGFHTSGSRIRSIDDSFLSSNEGSEFAICQFLVGAMRSAGVQSRMVFRLKQSDKVKDDDVWAELYLTSTKDDPSNVKRWYRAFGSISRVAEAEDQERAWIRTRTVDPSRRKTNHSILDRTPRRTDGEAKDFVCLVAIGDGNLLSDVTSRYSTRRGRNLITKYLGNTMHEWNDERQAIGDISTDMLASTIDEFSEINKLVESCVPTTVQGFRKDSDYVLSTFIDEKRHTLVKGAKPVNVFRGQPVYRRQDLAQLHTEWGWKKLGRRVKACEFDNPTKLLPARIKIKMSTNIGHLNDDVSAPRDEVDDDANGDNVDPRRKLFDESQTDPVDPGHVDETTGKFPVNEFGNVELFSPLMLPRGSAHLVGVENVEDACKSLQVFVAAAVVGFEWKDGRTKPKTNGVVVAASRRNQIIERAQAITAQKRMDDDRDAIKKRARLWRELLEARWVVMFSAAAPTASVASPSVRTPNLSLPSIDTTNAALATTTTTLADRVVPNSSTTSHSMSLSKRHRVEPCIEHKFVKGRCIQCEVLEGDIGYL